MTIPYDQTFRNQENRPTSGNAATSFNYCGCGWPQHMLIAKGNAEGMAAELFVMITDARNDTVPSKKYSATILRRFCTVFFFAQVKMARRLFSMKNCIPHAVLISNLRQTQNLRLTKTLRMF